MACSVAPAHLHAGQLITSNGVPWPSWQTCLVFLNQSRPSVGPTALSDNVPDLQPMHLRGHHEEEFLLLLQIE